MAYAPEVCQKYAMDEKINRKIKKWVSIVLILAVILAASIYAYDKLNEVKIASIDSIVPDEAIYYIYSYALNNKIKDFQASPFFQQVIANSAYNKYITPKLEILRQKIPFLGDIFEKDAALAVFSLGGKIGQVERKDLTDFGDFLFLARIDKNKHIKIKKAIADLYLKFTPGRQIAQNKYKGITITNYKIPKSEITIRCALLSDILVISNSSSTIQKSIDLFRIKNHYGSLHDNSRFVDLKTRIKTDPLLWGYEDLRRYYEEIMQEYAYNSLKANEPKNTSNLISFIKAKPFTDFMNIFEGVVFYLDYDELKSGFIFKSYNVFNKTGDKSILDVILYNKEVDKTSFRLVPRDIIGYYGGNQDFLKLWKVMNKFYASTEEIMKAEWKNDPRYSAYKDRIDSFSFKNIIKVLESFLGISIENDLLATIGNNFGMVFSGLEDIDIPIGLPQKDATADQKQIFSFLFPEFYGFIDLKDSQKMSETMTKMTQHIIEQANEFFQKQDEIMAKYVAKSKGVDPETVAVEKKQYFKLNTEEYSGGSIRSIDITNFPVDFIKPNYCVIDKYLIFSLSPLLTKKAIDTYKNNRGSFISGTYFESAKENLPSSYSNIVYFYFKKMISDIKSTKFYGRLQKDLSGNKRNNVTKEELDSVLSILSNINALTYTNRLSDTETIESSCYIGVKGL